MMPRGALLVLVTVFLVVQTSCSANRLTVEFHRTASDYFSESGERELAEKAATGDVEGINRLIASGVAIDTAGAYGVTPLAWAVGAANLEGVERLLQLGANPNRSFETNSSVLVLSIRMGDVRLFELLLKYKADPNWDDQNSPTAMSCLMLRDNAEYLRLALQNGGDPNRHTDVNNLLEDAVSLQHFDKAWLLLAAGADLAHTSQRAKERIEKRMVIGHWAFSKDPDYNKCLAILRAQGFAIEIPPDAPTKSE